VSDSATSSAVSQVGTDRVGQVGGGVREAVLAGPGVVAGLEEDARSSLLERLVGCDAVRAALASCGHVDVRRRVLPGEVTVNVVLGLGLFSGEGYDSVLAKVVPALSGPLPPGAGVPTGSALSQARARVDEKVFQALFRVTAAEPERGPVVGACEFGLELTAFDGTTFDLADTDAMRVWFATPTGGRHPQARVLTLTACGTRKVRAAAVGSSATSEQELVDTLVDDLTPGTLNLADRNFFSMARFLACAATGAQLAWRLKNSNQHLPAKVTATLPDGSQLVRLHESDAMLARRRRRNAGECNLPRLPDTIARLVEFDLFVKDERGRTRRSRFRILTTLLDHHVYPAQAIAAVYAQRWQAELAYYRIKVSLRGNGVVLRGQTPNLAKQEIWALLSVYNTLCDLAAETAVSLGLDPDQISFVAVLRLTRSHAAPACACASPAEASQALRAAIAAHPTNRHGRKRTSPRTKKDRRTERTRDVTYTINIVTSNLPKVEDDLLT
jgi:Insertion element 4 transposase N-terminal/Transposase DDE domain